MNTTAVILSILTLAAFWAQRASPRNAHLSTKQAAHPKPFFTSGTSVLDLYDGNGAERDALSMRAEIVIVMFYAPWSSHCVEARDVFNEVSNTFRALNSTVQFIAVNCHDHRGGCRSSYKLYSYPIIFAYVSNGPLVLFNKPRIADILVSWIIHLKRPYVRIQTDVEFTNFLIGSDFAVVAFIHPYESPGIITREFNVFYASSLKATVLPYHVSFAVIQNPALANRWGLTHNHCNFYTSYHLNPRSLSSLAISSTTKSDNLIQWIKEIAANMEWQIVGQLSLNDDENGAKSLFRKTNATDGVLVLFTNGVHTNQFSFVHQQLKSLVMAFNDCSPKKHDSSATLWNGTFHGLACHINRTLGFLAVERRLAKSMIQRWKMWSNYELLHNGGDFENAVDSVVLISNVDEQFFWLENSDLTMESMSRLITNFVTENLPPNRPILIGKKKDPTKAEIVQALEDKDFSRLSRITVSEFLSDIVGQSNDFDVFVFIFGGQWHGPSQFVPHILHVVTNYFKRFNSLIKFSILDASKNQLPWQYTFETLPAFVFFPARRKMESIAFPTSDFLPTVPNLMAFLLAHCQPKLRVELALSMCGFSCLLRNLEQIRAFFHYLHDDIRSLRRAIRHTHAFNDQLRALLKRRFMQRRAARHLQDTISALISAKRNGDTKSTSPIDSTTITSSQQFTTTDLPTKTLKHLTNDLMLLRWILKNHASLSIIQ